MKMSFNSKLNECMNKELPVKLMGNSHIAIVDTETTGFSKVDHDLISLSCEIRNHNWELQDEKTLYSAPSTKKRWTPKAEEIHGFSYDEACSFSHPRKTAIEFLHFLRPFKTDDNRPLLLVSHDLNGFDFGFMEWLFRWQGLEYSFWKVFNPEYRLSTINMAKQQDYKKNKLNDWATRLNIELDHHEVESDRIACSKVFRHLIENYNGLGFNN